MHHKRKRPKSSMAGCLMCKPNKHQRNKDSFRFHTRQEQKAIISEREQKLNLF